MCVKITDWNKKNLSIALANYIISQITGTWVKLSVQMFFCMRQTLSDKIISDSVFSVILRVMRGMFWRRCHFWIVQILALKTAFHLLFLLGGCRGFINENSTPKWMKFKFCIAGSITAEWDLFIYVPIYLVVLANSLTEARKSPGTKLQYCKGKTN